MQSLQNTKLLINEAKNLGDEFEIVNDKVTISAPEAIPQDLLSELKKKKHLVLQIIMNDIDASKDQLNISNKNPQKICLPVRASFFLSKKSNGFKIVRRSSENGGTKTLRLYRGGVPSAHLDFH